MLDRERAVVMGGSYGGYMALASLVSYNDRLRGGVDVVGISNFNTFLKKHLTLPAGPASRRVRRRCWIRRVRVFLAHLAVQQLDVDPEAAAGGAGVERSARAGFGRRSRWSPGARELGARRGISPRRMAGHGFRKKSNRDFYHADRMRVSGEAGEALRRVESKKPTSAGKSDSEFPNSQPPGD